MKKKRIALTAAAAMAAAGALLSGSLQANAAETDYELYPIPQSIQYQEGSFTLSDEINVVYESGIDAETKERLNEAARLGGVTVSATTEVAEGKTNILVGIKGDTDTKVDDYAETHLIIANEDLFTKTDSYVLESDNGVITVLGKDSDAAFYGLTTLYHIIDQTENKTIRNFQIEDYADIVSRGFIEGYYGNPWSTEDRIKLMEWGGYYKLNSYFYAPKNDPKHNSQWKSLYTDQEIDELIKPLAEAGNRSKCRFVYALHPYMYNAIRHNSEENYQADLAAMQAKFDQVIAAGVRQIAILADDAANVGGANYTRMLTDMTSWIRQKQQTYPDLKLTLPFVTQEYMYNGESYYSDFPENVQIVMTGGRIWGEVSQSFTNTFTTNAGRGPYLWINWPCTDNSKSHLIMGGYSNFLHPGVDPAKIQGIVLNPMQQSEPSKVAIFGNAAYCWNIWESAEVANQAWEASFKYVDGNSARETEASEALRELSKHMMNQAMDSRVVALQESVELKTMLTPFREKLSNNASITEAEIAALEAEFEKLQQAAGTYRENANDTRVRDQIVYWLDCWDDTTEAALAYLQGIRDFQTGNQSGLVNNYIRGQAAFSASRTHALWYLDHYEYAEVGVQHIVPFLRAMDTWLGRKALEAIDPEVVTYTYISDVYTSPYSGSPEDVLDGDDSTAMVFHEPNLITAGQYIGVQFSSPITLDNVRFALGGGKNHFYYSKLEYQTADSEEWQEISSEEYARPFNSEEPISAAGLGLENVTAVRLRATRDNGVDSWLNIKSIDINKEEEPAPAEPLAVTSVTNSSNVTIAGGNISNVTDGSLTTEVWLKSAEGDFVPADAAVTLDLGEARAVGSVYIAQDTARSGGSDILSNGVVEYSLDNATWTTLGSMSAQNEQTVLGAATARYIRVRNTQRKNVWWRLSEIKVFSAQDSPLSMAVSPINLRIGNHNNVNDAGRNNRLEYIVDGDMDTLAWLAGSDNGNIPANGGVEITFSKEIPLTGIRVVQANGSNDKVPSLTASYKDSAGAWHEIGTRTNAGDDVVFSFSAVNAAAIKLVNSGSATNAWWKLYEVSVTEASQDGDSTVYTNSVNAAGFAGNINSSSADLSAGRITLAPGEYIGLDLQAIRDIAALRVEGDGTSSAALEISANGMQWETAEAGEVTGKTARYVRLNNRTADALELNIGTFSIAIRTIGRLGELISSDIPVTASWGDDRNNYKAFDGDMATKQKFGGNPQAGNTAVYSLGQEIDIDSIRIYTTDSTQDFIRDAKVQLSTDGVSWEDAFTIGDGVTDTNANTTMGDLALGSIDSNYPNVRYYGEEGINKRARYMRLYITANFPSRAIIINEIVINGGSYISEESNAAFSGTLEVAGHKPSYILDKDLTTTYKPSQANGSLSYSMSEAGTLSFRIVQSGEVSNATVKARVLGEGNGEETVTLGELADSINDFQIPAGKELAEIIVEWQTKLPEIAELIITKDAQRPTAPAAATADEITSDSAKLNWAAATDNLRVVKYEIYQGTDLLAIAEGTSCEAVLTGLNPETSYELDIYAYDSAGNQSESRQVSFTTLEPGAPSGGGDGGDSGDDREDEVIEEYKQQLRALIASAKEKIAADKYTEASAAKLQAEVTKAEALLKAAAPGTAELQGAVSSLDSALEALEEKEVKPNEKPDKAWIFTDVNVNAGNWKYESVKYVYNNDIMGAITGTTNFQPDRPLSRSMFATVLYRMAGEPKVAFENKFTDVAAGKWYSDAIIWAYKNKIVAGYTDGSFGINDNITREQIAKMLFEYAKVSKYDISERNDLGSFTDEASVSGWAVEYMQWATAVKMITGKPNDDQKTYRMDPKGDATRAECAAMLTRFAEKYNK
ncbi:MAG: beta-N-acetylglucosaminidase domain-containing protein [Lachnospiraceae bacterium]|nr:beta-N-acetylglucosaminidase domain-containing protein [Lachnospiraceae bacterium]